MRRWCRPVMAVAVAALAGTPHGAHAADLRGSVYGFGDSLLDLRFVCPLQYPKNASGACGNGRGLLQQLPSHAPYSLNLANDQANGGAGTGTFNIANGFFPRAVGTLTQIQDFTAAGGRIGARDLTLVSGRNNFFQLLLNPALSGTTLARSALTDVDREVGGLINVGARDIVYFDTRSPSAPHNTQTDAYESNFAAGLPGVLAGHAQPGVRIRLLNLTGLSAAVAADPQRFGFSTGLSCATDGACATSPIAVQDQHFLFDQHPTETGYDLIARYIANLDASADGIGAQAQIAAAASDSISGTLLDHASTDTLAGRRGLFLDASYAHQRRRSWSGDEGVSAGYKDEVGQLVAGYTLPLDDKSVAGVAFGYARSNGALNDDAGSVRADTYQLGAYLDRRSGPGFVDATASYARHQLHVSRPGVIDDLAAAPHAWTIAAQLRGGWLFDGGPVRFGPVLRLSYDRTRVGGYTENGDPLLTQQVGATTAETLIGRAGLRLEHAANAAAPLGGFLEVNVGHDFVGGERTLITANTYAPDLPIFTVIGSGSRSRTFGEIDAAATHAASDRVQLFFRGAATVFRGDAQDYSVAAGVHVAL